MKLLSYIIAFVLVIACKKNSETSNNTSNDNTNLGSAVLLKQGTFSGANGYQISGTVKLYDSVGKKIMVFENFSSSNGPDLKVYFSANAGNSNFISLGNLKSTSGNQVYNIPGNPDLNTLRYAVIWCQQFSVLFGSSLLQ